MSGSPPSTGLCVSATGGSSIVDATAQQAAQRLAPRIVALELILTEACNLECTYCFEYEADRRQSMTRTTAVAAVDFLIEASRKSEWVHITLMGGEPMLRYELIREVVAHGRRRASDAGKRVTFGMTTNGTLLKEEHLHFFRKYSLRYCLSLDGDAQSNDRYRKTRGGMGTYELVAAKIPLLKKYQPWQGARMTVMPDTASNLCHNVKCLHEELAINQFIVGFATHIRWTDREIADYGRGLRETFEYYVEQLVARRSRRLRIALLEVGALDEAHSGQRSSGWGCGAGSGRLAVAPDGTFHGCSKLAWAPGGSRAAAMSLGSVSSGLNRWHNRLKLLTHTDTVRHKCRSCEMATFCQGGCYAANYADTGNIYLPADTYCKLVYAQKDACDYGRTRLKALGLRGLHSKSARLDMQV